MSKAKELAERLWYHAHFDGLDVPLQSTIEAAAAELDRLANPWIHCNGLLPHGNNLALARFAEGEEAFFGWARYRADGVHLVSWAFPKPYTHYCVLPEPPTTNT